jgi:hypothetical protein
MSVTATVCWNISNVYAHAAHAPRDSPPPCAQLARTRAPTLRRQQCAERAAETMDASGNGRDTGTINKLRGDVLKQAEASLSALIGKVHHRHSS